MSSEELIVLRLEVDRYADPISGTVTQGNQTVHSFTGWLALTDAIESIRTDGVGIEAVETGTEAAL